MSNSQKRYGAMPSEWELVKASRLTSRVLPIVSNPELTAVGALTKSNTRGKVPSVKTKTGAVAGMQNWTRHETTPEEIEQWSKDPDNGFCIRTGGDLGIIAIDCDCDNAERAGEIRELFSGMIGAPDIPLRKRGGARWAALLIISDHKPGENISKKIIAMPDGDKVEILADGQQLACCGTHPKGTRYSWSGRPFVDIPEIKGEILDSFIDTISTLYGVENVQTASAGVRVKGQTFKAMDPVRDFLEERGAECGDIVKSAAAGIMEHIREFTMLTNSTVNSYARLGEFTAPRDIIWSDEEGSQLIRMSPDSDDVSVELRAADCVCDPYLVLGLMIYSALEGISSGAVLPEKNSGTERLPETLEVAADIAEKSEFLKKYIPENILEVLIRHSREEWKEFISAYDKEAFEDKKYFCSL